MADKKYTEQEVTEMADRTYNHCMGFFKCGRYTPVNYANSGKNSKAQGVFKCSNPGCFYAAELPWSDDHWCWLVSPKDRTDVKTLWALTPADLLKKAKENSR